MALSDFDRIASAENLSDYKLPDFDSPPQGLTGQQEIQQSQQSIEKLRTVGANLGVQNKMNDNPLPPSKMTMNADGTIDMKGLPRETFEAYQRDRQELNQIRGSFAQEAARLQQQEEYQRQHPWAHLAAALGANLGQAKDMPGWVQGLAKTSAQLNPSADELRSRRMGVLGQEAQLAERSAAMESQIQGASLDKQRFELEKRREGRLTDTAQHEQASKTFKELSMAAQKAELTDPGLTSEVFQQSGMPKQEADTKAEMLVRVSQEKRGMLDRAEAAKTQREKDEWKERARESDNRIAAIVRGVALKSSDKTEADEALRDTAKALVSDDLTAIRDVSSMRGTDRSKIFSYARKLDPNFSMAELNRKIDMEKSFSVGKDGQAIQSFDTFLQHAGEVTETVKGIQQTDSRLLNHSMNWWRKNMSGSPEYQRLATSLEPVGKEFEKFLLNQGALYKDDRDKINALLDSDVPLGQVMAALNQMGKTAKDRYGALNQRYKRVMKKDIENPFSQEALAGASKIGIDLGHKVAAADPASAAQPGEKTATGKNGEKYALREGKWVLLSK